MASTQRPAPSPVSVSVVIPVYRGAATLPPLIAELEGLRSAQVTPAGREFVIHEVLLVWDHGPDDSDRVIRALAAEKPWVRPVWLSRNFGQHAATIAGMGASGGDWIVTMDEDGQHDPAAIALLIDAAYAERANLVYAAPGNSPPHGALRNAASWIAKRLVLPLLTSRDTPAFHSYRLIAGDVGRAVSAYAGPNVYLDIALGWVTTDVATISVNMRSEGREAANYRLRSLVSHFWRLVLSSGNRPLRLVSAFGSLCAVGGLLFAAWLVVARITGAPDVAGWTSVIVCVLVIGGVTLGSLGIIAEYLGLAASMSMGRPNYVTLEDPAKRFGQRAAAED
ncbi:glycosyltransferase [Sanguibacter hominis ATCC BAA-789]|uniref:Glycosyltransferase n=1 Tax=Sanguibacter hominis ATCC BAA-789 TaxID=1312740 RepID=A0A9X5FK76_9MICO|nr:glycosyltransferase [Sanguibacter hominis]NKX93593.1 glycosyltransferase [Sanguibacter hominis ATCC BAA-789]